MSNLLDNLNANQRLAASLKDGPSLVIAGAGSGKTRVIEYRVANLVQSGVSPQSILLLTFTRKAAKEMTDRAQRHDARCKGVMGGTFHHFANQQIRTYANSIGLDRNFTILDRSDATDAIDRCATELGLREQKKRFPKKDTLADVFSKASNLEIDVQQVLEKEYPHFVDDAATIAKLRERYTRFKLEMSSLDLDDLLVYLEHILEQEDLNRRITQRFRYVLVDEYQDTNGPQGRITKLLGKSHHNVMVVGDDAQSIYRFRGAQPQNIFDFEKVFPNCTKVTLDANYRSTQGILNVANAILRGMSAKFSKTLYAHDRRSGTKPNLRFFEDGYEEAEWIADQIKLHRDSGVALHEQATLFRSSFLSIPLQAALSARKIPFVVYGGIRISESAHVKDVLAHLKVIANPRDVLGWDRLLRLLPGIGPKSAFDIGSTMSLSQDMKDAVARLRTSAHDRPKLRSHLNACADLFAKAISMSLPVDKYDAVLAYYRPIMQESYDDWNKRHDDLSILRQVVARYDQLEPLLSDLSLDPIGSSVDGVNQSDDEDERPTVLSTIHSAKGLEWRHVFLLGMSDGQMPSARSLDDDEEVEEEKRLLYVAITRAKENLWLSFNGESTAGRSTGILSRFLNEPGVLASLELYGGQASRITRNDTLDTILPTKDTTPPKEKLLDRLLRNLLGRGK